MPWVEKSKIVHWKWQNLQKSDGIAHNPTKKKKKKTLTSNVIIFTKYAQYVDNILESTLIHAFINGL